MIQDAYKNQRQSIPNANNNRKRYPERSFPRTTRKRIQCWLCHNEHWLANCPKLMNKNLPERINIMRDLNVCLNCLGFGHRRLTCERRGCQNCYGEKHNSVLCPKSINTSRAQIRVAGTANVQQKK